MDDIYFSDKKKKAPQESSDKYLKTDYFDEEFSLEFKKRKGNAQSFAKESNDDDSFSSFGDESGAEQKPSARRPVPSNELYSDGKAEQDEAALEAPEYKITPVKSASARQVSSRSTYTRPVASRASGAPVRRTPSGAPVGSASRTPTGKRMPAQNNLNPSGKRPPQKKKSNKKKIVLAVAVSLFLIVFGVAVWGYFTVDGMINNLDYDTTIVHDKYLSNDAPKSEGVKNILLIGSDARKGVQGQRSDTMILLSIDSTNEQIKLTSFLRDSYVYIPAIEGKNKINASFGKGGAQGVIDSIEYNFGINVHNYAAIDFYAFEKLVDLMGGVTIEGVTAKEAKFMNKEAKTNIVEGTNHMNGYEALWYCRIRKLDSDFYRTMRQRKVLSAIIKKAGSMKYNEMLDVIEQVLPEVSTDLSKKELKTLGLNAIANYLGYDIVQQQIPADGTWRDGRVNGSYVIEFDIDTNKEIVRNFVYNKVEETTQPSDQTE